MSCLVKDESGKGFLVAFNISSSLAQPAVEDFLRWVYEEAGMPFPQFCVVDEADAEINALISQQQHQGALGAAEHKVSRRPAVERGSRNGAATSKMP